MKWYINFLILCLLSSSVYSLSLGDYDGDICPVGSSLAVGASGEWVCTCQSNIGNGITVVINQTTTNVNNSDYLDNYDSTYFCSNTNLNNNISALSSVYYPLSSNPASTNRL